MHREDAARGNIELFQPQMSQRAQTKERGRQRVPVQRGCEGDLAGEVGAVWERNRAGWGHPRPAWNREN